MTNEVDAEPIRISAESSTSREAVVSTGLPSAKYGAPFERGGVSSGRLPLSEPVSIRAGVD